MRRWILKAGATELDGLIQEETATPKPGPGEVLVRVRAVSLNRRDQMTLDGQYGRVEGRDLVPLSDGAGEIEAVGTGVDMWAVGDRVVSVYLRKWVYGPPHLDVGLGLGAGDEDGMLAEQVVLAADRVVRMPATLDFAEAATLPCAGLTAWNAVHGAVPAGPGSRVLILGSGGVSLFAFLFARAAGAIVAATTGAPAKADRLRAMGVSDVVNYRDIVEWGAAIFERTGGVDKVVDVGGVGSLNQALAAIRPGGEIATMGFMAQGGDVPDPMLLIGKAANIRGVGVGSVEMFGAMARAIDDMGLKPLVGERFSFDQAREAYQAQQSPEMFGKIVLAL